MSHQLRNQSPTWLLFRLTRKETQVCIKRRVRRRDLDVNKDGNVRLNLIRVRVTTAQVVVGTGKDLIHVQSHVQFHPSKRCPSPL